jgi:hypothetical protein
VADTMNCTEVQIISKDHFGELERKLADAEVRYWQLHTSARSEQIRLEAGLQNKVEEQSRESTNMQHEEDGRPRHTAPRHATPQPNPHTTPHHHLLRTASAAQDRA